MQGFELLLHPPPPSFLTWGGVRCFFFRWKKFKKKRRVFSYNQAPLLIILSRFRGPEFAPGLVTLSRSGGPEFATFSLLGGAWIHAWSRWVLWCLILARGIQVYLRGARVYYLIPFRGVWIHAWNRWVLFTLTWPGGLKFTSGWMTDGLSHTIKAQ